MGTSSTKAGPIAPAFRHQRPRPRAAAVRALCLTALIGLLATGCSRLFFMPEREHRWDPATAGVVYEDVSITTEDGVRLHGWFLPAQGEARATVVFFHGNAQNVSTHIGAVYWLPSRRFNVLMPDYRGFGRSEGRPDFAGVHKDAAATLAFAAERDEPLVVLGQSLGGSVAITTTAEHGEAFDVRALIADSAFSSYRGIAREKLAEAWLTWPLQWPLSLTISDRFAPIDRIDAISPVPILLIAGGNDPVVPDHHSEALYGAAREPVTLWRYPEIGHTQALARDDVRDRLVAWLTATLDDAEN